MIAGRGTIGVEVHGRIGECDAIVVPVGGGGLISGIAVAMKTLNPDAKVIGVQPPGAPAGYPSYRRGDSVEVQRAYGIADGVAVKRPGDLTLRIMRSFVDDIVPVDEREIAKAISLMLERVKTVVEGFNVVEVEHERPNPLVHPGVAQVSLSLEVPKRGAVDLPISELRGMGSSSIRWLSEVRWPRPFGESCSPGIVIFIIPRSDLGR